MEKMNELCQEFGQTANIQEAGSVTCESLRVQTCASPITREHSTGDLPSSTNNSINTLSKSLQYRVIMPAATRSTSISNHSLPQFHTPPRSRTTQHEPNSPTRLIAVGAIEQELKTRKFQPWRRPKALNQIWEEHGVAPRTGRTWLASKGQSREEGPGRTGRPRRLTDELLGIAVEYMTRKGTPTRNEGWKSMSKDLELQVKGGQLRRRMKQLGFI